MAGNGLAERIPDCLRHPIGRGLDLVDTGPAIAILLALHVFVWTSFQIISYASIDLHQDLVEIYAWSRHPSLGYLAARHLGRCRTVQS